MEFVEGSTLAGHIRSHGRLAVPNALAIFRHVCEAVAYLHSHNIIHCDLKPANIKLTPDGTIKLLDFGIARSLHCWATCMNKQFTC
jgi:eukaryotic-like serine/threonine-protein kinase